MVHNRQDAHINIKNIIIMKTFDFDRKFKDYKGDEIGDNTMSVEISKALYSAGVPDLPIEQNEKYLAYKISTKLIACSGVVDLGDEDVLFLKKFCGVAFSAGAYGQIVNLLES